MGTEKNCNYNKVKRKNINYISSSIIIILFICFCLLLTNNLKTYAICSKLTTELEKTKKQEQKNNLQREKKNSTLMTESNELKTKLSKKLDIVLSENKNLKKINAELSDDNINLQNSLKLAAMSGIKPKNYDRPPVISSRYLPERARYLGKFKGTAYTPSAAECGNNKGLTCSGKPIIPGTTIAVDTKYWPIGTVFYIKGIGLVTAMDTGSAVKGRNRFDFAVFDRKFAFALGARNWDVYLMKMGNGKV